MKHIFSLLVMLMAGVVLMPSTAEAGHILDDFSSATDASNANLDRASIFGTFVMDEGFRFGNAGVLSYETMSGTFSDYGTSFSIGVSADAGSMFEVEVVDENFDTIATFMVDDSTSTLNFSGIGSTSVLTFNVSRDVGGFLTLGGGEFSFTAVPEPTSLALVGLAASGLAFRRRRRS